MEDGSTTSFLYHSIFGRATHTTTNYALILEAKCMLSTTLTMVGVKVKFVVVVSTTYMYRKKFSADQLNNMHFEVCMSL